MSHGSTAKAVRLRKEAHPEWYCRESRCLWFTGSPERPGTPCKKHPRFVSKYAQQFEGALAILEQTALEVEVWNDSRVQALHVHIKDEKVRVAAEKAAKQTKEA